MTYSIGSHPRSVFASKIPRMSIIFLYRRFMVSDIFITLYSPRRI